MTDREKVLKGLEQCSRRISDRKVECSKCPYDSMDQLCVGQLLADALKLLNEKGKPTLYKKLIRPMHLYPGLNYDPLRESIEEEEIWYPEEECERLEEKYSYLDGPFSALVFDEKYEPYLDNEAKNE